MLSFAPTTTAAGAPLAAALAPRRAPGGLAALQRSFGNQAVQRALRDSESPEELDPGESADQDAGTDAGTRPAPAAPSPPPSTAPATPAAPPSTPSAPPTAPPAAPAVSVTLPAHVRAPSSPAGMPDRIPPRVDTEASVAITGLAASALPVTLSIDGASAASGTATINGAATVDLRASATVKLRGATQTTPGNAGNLTLVANQGANRLAATPGFSVAAIPQNWSVSFNSLITGTALGIAVNNAWESDSGVVADLDEAQRSEQVQYGTGTGALAGFTGLNSGYRAANHSPIVDRHSTGRGWLTGVGHIQAEQVFIFMDNRTGAVDIPARNSGFHLIRDITAPSPGALALTMTKAGAATTANGYSSGAASGSVSRTQAV